MRAALFRIRVIDARDRWYLLALWGLLPLIHALLAMLGYGRCRRLLERLSPSSHAPPGPCPPAAVTRAQRLVALAEIAGRRGLVSTTCLRQALAVYWLLRWRGVDPQLCIGARRVGARLDAHAWVELNGQPLSSNGHRYATFKPPSP